MSDLTLSHDENNQPANSSATILPNTASEIANIQNMSSYSFWQSFHVFSSPFEKWCVRRWYWLLALFYITLIPTYILIDLNHKLIYESFWSYFFSKHSYTMFFLSNWSYNLFVIGMFLLLYNFYIWQKKIPNIFQMLQQKYIISSIHQGPVSSNEEFQRVLDEYQYAILYGRKRLLTRHFITGGLMLLTSILLIFWWMLYNFQDLSTKAVDYNLFVAILFGFRSVIEETTYSLLLVYLAIQIFWILTTTGVYLARVAQQFELLIQPGHTDRCGGLKFLGDFSLNMASILILVCVLFAFYTNSSGYSFWSAGTSIALGIILCLANFVFFAPLKELRRQMLKARSPYEEVLVTSTTKAIENLRITLSEGDATKIKKAKEEFEIIQSLHPDKIGYATWPIDRSIGIAFFAPQIVPVISFIIGLTPSLSEALKGILSIFSGGK